MSVLSGKKVVLGVTAGIAAYKTASLVRIFIKLGAEVKVVMTPKSKNFITPLVLSTLSKNPVYSTFFDKNEEKELWNNHVNVGVWADYMVIAPASANTISKMANGVCNNFLLAAYLSAKCPVYIAPAMDLDMYAHPSTKKNLNTLDSFGNKIIPATYGELASGLTGEGRMAEPKDIITFMENDILSKLPLKGKKVLVTAGPTYESIDPVRFIGNRSSGKMGFAIAKVAANLGAKVVLISGPSNQNVNNSFIKRIDVVSAKQMYDAVNKHFSNTDIAVLSAAVSDYKPKNIASQKIKKKDAALNIELTKTIDILESLGKIKEKQYLVGFALETNNEIENAKNKLQRKNLDAIILNSLKDKGSGFLADTNKITFIDNNFNEKVFELSPKIEVAKNIINEIIKRLDA